MQPKARADVRPEIRDRQEAQVHPAILTPFERVASRASAARRLIPGQVVRSNEVCVVDLAVVEQHVRVGVGGHGERALADAGADQRPGLALPMPEADSAVA
jgi:hypothetical protein